MQRVEAKVTWLWGERDVARKTLVLERLGQIFYDSLQQRERAERSA